ncbi:MAG: glutaredoxin family protein [Clostridium sp.]
MKNVQIYSSKNCEYCNLAKEFMKENGVDYKEFDVSSDKEAKKELIKKGYMSVPVIIVDGEEFVGFDKDKLSSVLGL